MKKIDIVRNILVERFGKEPIHQTAAAFAPTNIALCKYWGKRDQELNLPLTSSLSISLGTKGASVILSVSKKQDEIFLNNTKILRDSVFFNKLENFLNLFRNGEQHPKLKIEIQSNIPIAAGLASSACGFASIVSALNKLYGWNLNSPELSILARLGSGSASRSICQGFVEWHAGKRADGMDSYAETLDIAWNELCIGLLIFDTTEKAISSREAMQRTVSTSSLYPSWPDKVSNDLNQLKTAIQNQDFCLLGETAESNSMTMHATMLSAWPAINYSQAETLLSMKKVWDLRNQGLDIYFTQDAGPNLKLIFEKKNLEAIKEQFQHLDVVYPFNEIG